MRTRMRAAATVTGILAATAAIGAFTAPTGSDNPNEKCEVVHSYNATTGEYTDDETWNALVKKGWVGDPTDSMEALHSPGCNITNTAWPKELITK
jgi:hypothetical protein